MKRVSSSRSRSSRSSGFKGSRSGGFKSSRSSGFKSSRKSSHTSYRGSSDNYSANLFAMLPLPVKIFLFCIFMIFVILLNIG